MRGTNSGPQALWCGRRAKGMRKRRMRLRGKGRAFRAARTVEIGLDLGKRAGALVGTANESGQVMGKGMEEEVKVGE